MENRLILHMKQELGNPPVTAILQIIPVTLGHGGSRSKRNYSQISVLGIVKYSAELQL